MGHYDKQREEQAEEQKKSIKWISRASIIDQKLQETVNKILIDMVDLREEVEAIKELLEAKHENK